MTNSRRDAEEWAARFNERVPPGKDLVYEVYEKKPGRWAVLATHPERDARYCEPLRSRLAPVAASFAAIVFWGAVIGGCGYVLATSDWSSTSTDTSGGT